MKESKKINLSTFIIILCIIIIGIMSYLLYKTYNEKTVTSKQIEQLDAELGKIKNQVKPMQDTTTPNETIKEKETAKTYSYSEIKGVYKAKDRLWYELDLNENGTFWYEKGDDIATGVVGNYIIVNDTIILNYLFETGSDASLKATAGSKTLNINSDGSIVDTKEKANGLILKKSSEKKPDEFNLNKMINTFELEN